MKYLRTYTKLFESSDSFSLLNIVEVLQDYIDDRSLTLFSARGFAYQARDLVPVTQSMIDNFKFNRYDADITKLFKFKISFSKPKDYKELLTFLDEMNEVIGRFGDLGFSLREIVIEQTEEDNYSAWGVDFSFHDLDNRR